MSFEIYTGPMGAGKTLKLINLFSESKKTSKIILKPVQDKRSGTRKIKAHNGQELPAEEFENAGDLTNAWNSKLIFIDELQFLTPQQAEDILWLSKGLGKQVIGFGLNRNWKGETFPIMENLMNKADQVIFLHGVCEVCGAFSEFTGLRHPEAPLNSTLQLGGFETYISLCKDCFRSSESA